ncbi:hypothetical protein ASG92_05915 [Arthrobacter sp. Soil736]|uniref:hypothetical protein n=1 Tax=Arthrobacter sp. Soil736 TaxID=1736395 RepID=UPI0006FCC8D1|nr:hypothetical protein [Arthrobacter sp. Soil736]KRE53091.1 hypothetical protein ASG92_05915 [Arthrobacter sp. Soil736]
MPLYANGFRPAFSHETLDRVAWLGAGFTGFVTSYEGMKQVAVDAQAAAEAAAATAGADAAATATAAIGTATDEAEAAATSAARGALFLAVPSDGTMAVATLSSAHVFLHRLGGKWNYSAATQIAKRVHKTG